MLTAQAIEKGKRTIAAIISKSMNGTHSAARKELSVCQQLDDFVEFRGDGWRGYVCENPDALPRMMDYVERENLIVKFSGFSQGISYILTVDKDEDAHKFW